MMAGAGEAEGGNGLIYIWSVDNNMNVNPGSVYSISGGNVPDL